ncbi:hypothetical protein FEZ32_04820 [Acidipropionibacterium jensenii]|uniref:hypothetical protein n=1 Tax=Acidipropionibacterium jensenii TaxID=1749 RepID=UPI00110BE21D|nr:hypothetical protein [Acidipropionibacterium jensenii]QCV87781.1 hypothetical protein FEZ32_04820 [Acidipropionibacterium jensenii]
MMQEWERQPFGDHRDPREELSTIFGVDIPASGNVQPEALEWACGVVDVSVMSQVEAIKVLREAEPRLGLRSARYLVQRVFAATP